MSHLTRFLGVLLGIAALYALGVFVVLRLTGDIRVALAFAIPVVLFGFIVVGLFVTLWDITK